MTSTLIPKVNGEQPLVVVSHVKRKVTQSQLGVSPAQPTSLSPQNGSATPGSCARRAHAGWAAAAAAAAAAIARPRLARARRRDQVPTHAPGGPGAQPERVPLSRPLGALSRALSANNLCREEAYGTIAEVTAERFDANAAAAPVAVKQMQMAFDSISTVVSRVSAPAAVVWFSGGNIVPEQA
jgi:hypothetical protein